MKHTSCKRYDKVTLCVKDKVSLPKKLGNDKQLSCVTSIFSKI